jgi:hypothetical protein
MSIMLLGQVKGENPFKGTFFEVCGDKSFLLCFSESTEAVYM